MHTHLISIGFQIIEDDLDISPKKNLFFLNYYFFELLSPRFFLQTIRIVRYKILLLKVKENHFILIFVLHMNKCIFEA